MSPIKSDKSPVDLTINSKWSWGLKVTVVSTAVSIVGLAVTGIQARIQNYERMAKIETSLKALRDSDRVTQTQLNLVLARLMESQVLINKNTAAVKETKRAVAKTSEVVKETTKSLEEVGILTTLVKDPK